MDVAALIARALSVWVLLAVAEVAHGILRVRLLNRRVGDHRARQIGVFSGSVIIYGLTWITLPWLDPTSVGDCLAVGGLWLVAMLGLEIYFGRVVFRLPWPRIAADFNVRRGGLLGFGMAALFFAPWVVAVARHLF